MFNLLYIKRKRIYNYIQKFQIVYIAIKRLLINAENILFDIQLL